MTTNTAFQPEEQAPGEQPIEGQGNGDLQEAANNGHPPEAPPAESPTEPAKPGSTNANRVTRLNPNLHREVDLAHHKVRCSICNRPDREAIDEAFLHWRRSWDLVREFKIASRTSLYRQAHALGLFERRARNMRFALSVIIEEVETVSPSADAIIHAIRAYSCLDDSGHWTEPAKRLIVSRGDLQPSLEKPDDPNPPA
jgi:hypothetical protein